MKYLDARIARRLVLGFSLLTCFGLLASTDGGHGARAGLEQSAEAAALRQDFIRATAGVYARTQTLRQLEREMLANAGNPDRLAVVQHRRDAARRRIDGLLVEAQAAAGSDEDRRRLAQMAAITAQADARFEQLRTVLAGGQRPQALAGLAN